MTWVKVYEMSEPLTTQQKELGHPSSFLSMFYSIPKSQNATIANEQNWIY